MAEVILTPISPSVEKSSILTINANFRLPPKELQLRPAGQNARIVVPDAVHSGADGAPLVRAAMGFTHQVEESWRRRRQIEPFSRPAEVDYRRLPVADVGKPRGDPHS